RELIADYVKGKLPAANAVLFESALKKFPELERELNDTILVFKQIDAVDWNNIISERTRNLSVKVNRRLAANQSEKSFWTFSRLNISIVSAMLVLFVFIYRDDFVINGAEDQVKSSETQYSKVMHPTEYTVLIPHENMGIIPEIISDNSFENMLDELSNDFYDESLASSEEINLEIDDMFSDMVFDDTDISIDEYFFESSSDISSSVYDYIPDFSEKEFHLLMENLADADFNS
ncbi:MAG: hypothetical protein PF588_01530, partial [Candidatus Kapabacteria bacterium]|nr:hypothetical protein [Candidatus Kapabacteria bacterium]